MDEDRTYDVAVSPLDFPVCLRLRLRQTQALRLSDAFTAGSFGDQTFSPGLASPAGEAPGTNHFDASF